MTPGTAAPFRTLWVLIVVVALAVATLPAAADDTEDADVADPSSADQQEAEDVGPLHVTVRPKIVAPGRSVLIQAGYEIEWPAGSPERGDDQDEDADQGQDEEDGGVAAAAVAEAPGLGNGPDSRIPGRPVAVTFTIDFGDGSGERDMRLTRQDPRGQFGAALQQHTYAEAGDYSVTITATPTDEREVATTTVDLTVGAGSARLGGTDREETSAEVSLEGFPEDGSAEAVLIARSDHFADALASAPLAVEAKGPLLLAKTDRLPESVYDEIERALGEEGTVYILGGEAAIGGEVEAVLNAAGYQVERVAGEDRVGTAIAVTEFLLANGVEVTEVVLANDGAQGHFADALAGGAYAASVGASVLLTGADELDERVSALLGELDAPEVLAVGGEAVLTEGVLDAVSDLGLEVERIAGADRYATSLALAEARYDDPDALVFTTGSTFPDAVSAAAFAGSHGAPVLLVGDALTGELQSYLETLTDVQLAYIVGGQSAVPESLKADIEAVLGIEAVVE